MRLAKHFITTVILTLFTSLFIACSPTKITLDCNYMSFEEAFNASQNKDGKNGKWSYDFTKTLKQLRDYEDKKTPYCLELLCCTKLDRIYLGYDSENNLIYPEFMIGISIPETTVEIEEGLYNKSLEYISVSKKNPNYCDVNGILYNADKTELINIPYNAKIKTFEIPNTVKKANISSKNLKKLKISENLETLNPLWFSGCTALEDIEVAPQNKVFASIGDGVLWSSEGIEFISEKFNKKELYIPEGIPVLSNKYYPTDKFPLSYELLIPSKIEERFSCVKKLHIPSSVQSIDWDFFDPVNSNPSSSSLDSIINDKFSNLETISVSPENEHFFARDGILFEKNFKQDLKKVFVEGEKDDEKLVKVPANKKFGTDGKYVIPENVLVINYAAFRGCNNLKSIEFNSKIRQISDATFCKCSNLTEVFFENSSEERESLELFPYAFSGSGLKYFEFTNYMRVLTRDEDGIYYDAVGIPTSCFEDCEDLETIKLSDFPNDQTVHQFVFWRDCFFGCHSLKSFVLPKNMTSCIIGDSVFSEYSTSIEFIEFPGTEDEWNDINFYSTDDNFFGDIEIIFKDN